MLSLMQTEEVFRNPQTKGPALAKMRVKILNPTDKGTIATLRRREVPDIALKAVDPGSDLSLRLAVTETDNDQLSGLHTRSSVMQM